MAACPRHRRTRSLVRAPALWPLWEHGLSTGGPARGRRSGLGLPASRPRPESTTKSRTTSTVGRTPRPKSLRSCTGLLEPVARWLIMLDSRRLWLLVATRPLPTLKAAVTDCPPLPFSAQGGRQFKGSSPLKSAPEQFISRHLLSAPAEVGRRAHTGQPAGGLRAAPCTPVWCCSRIAFGTSAIPRGKGPQAGLMRTDRMVFGECFEGLLRARWLTGNVPSQTRRGSRCCCVEILSVSSCTLYRSTKSGTNNVTGAWVNRAA
jgi:hypothetical protein